MNNLINTQELSLQELTDINGGNLAYEAGRATCKVAKLAVIVIAIAALF